jgi:hypothetical protein
MPANNALTTLDGLFKERFAPSLENAIPEIMDLQVRTKFYRDKRLGLLYRQPVILGREHGFSYIIQGDSNTSLPTLATAIAGQIKPAQVVGFQHVGRSQIDYASLHEGEDLQQAFDNSFGVVARNLKDSHHYRLEIDLLYGQDSNGLGTVSAATVGANGTIVVTTAQWASGMWNGAEGALIGVLSSALTTSRGTFTITAVDADARQITGDTIPAATVATDVLVFGDPAGSVGMRSTSTWRAQVGLHKILNNTSGTIFNVSSTSFSLWRGNVFSAGSVDLTFEHILKSFAKASFKGATGQYVTYVNLTTFANMMSDQAALRRYDKADSPATYVVGAKDITFYTQTGEIMIKGHPMVKEGFAYGFAPRLFKRVGATDITFDNTRMEGFERGTNQFFVTIPDKPGVEIRSFDDQALFTESIGKSFAITSIVNS